MLVGYNGTPRSLSGVATLDPPWRNIIHKLFQRKYLLLGKKYPTFSLRLSQSRAVAKKQGRAFDLFMLRQTLAVSMCEASNVIQPDYHYLIIGDGYGALGSILAEAFPNCTITFVNIKPVLPMDKLYFSLAHPRREANFIEAEENLILPKANLSFDLACMQEINPDVRNMYFQLLKKSVTYSYSLNRLSKTFPDGTITNFEEYPWGDALIIFEGLPPWNQDFYSFIPPFRRFFDGPVGHKLVCWKNNGE